MQIRPSMWKNGRNIHNSNPWVVSFVYEILPKSATFSALCKTFIVQILEYLFGQMRKSWKYFFHFNSKAQKYIIDADLYFFYTIFQLQSVRICLFTFSSGLWCKGSGRGFQNTWQATSRLFWKSKHYGIMQTLLPDKMSSISQTYLEKTIVTHIWWFMDQ